MSDMQTKILGAISDRITAAGQEAVSMTEWANTGKVYAQQEFNTRLSVDYSFQSGYATIKLIPAETPQVPATGYGAQLDHDGWTYHALKYTDGDRIVQMLDAITFLLGPVAPVRHEYEIAVTRSDGPDGAIVIFIDGEFTTTGLRVVVNDNDVHADPEHIAPEDGKEREALAIRFNFNLDDVAYVGES